MDPWQSEFVRVAPSALVGVGAAGTGKTTALLSRGLRLIHAGIEVHFFVPRGAQSRALEEGLRRHERTLERGWSGEGHWLVDEAHALDADEIHLIEQHLSRGGALSAVGLGWEGQGDLERLSFRASYRASRSILAVAAAVAGRDHPVERGPQGAPVSWIYCGTEDEAAAAVVAWVGQRFGEGSVAVVCAMGHEAMAEALLRVGLPVGNTEDEVRVFSGWSEVDWEVDALVVVGLRPEHGRERGALSAVLGRARHALALVQVGRTPPSCLQHLPSWAVLYTAPPLQYPPPHQLTLF